MSVTFAAGHVHDGSRDVVRFGFLRFWAENGLIHVEDARDNSYECMSVRTALRRVNAISEMLGNSTRREVYTEDQFDRANRLRNQNMLDGITNLLQKAQIQGMPDDPSAMRDVVRRLPKSVVVPTMYGGGM
jgi:hypothetical protein